MKCRMCKTHSMQVVKVAKHQCDIRCMRCGYSINAALAAARARRKARETATA